MDKKKFTNTGDGAIRVDAQYDGSMLNKNGGYHKGQVNDAEKEEMNDNIATGKGPAKPKSVVTARPKSNVELNRDSDDIAKAVPRIADVIKEEKEKKKDPDYKRSKKINKKLLG